MKLAHLSLSGVLLVLAGCSASPAPMPESEAKTVAPAPAEPLGDATRPIVVELFQSQGCSSCPPAIANVNAIAERTDVLALTFAVTSWDRLGWKDTFAAPEYTARQWDYAHAADRGNVFTPQVVVNGETSIVGADPRQLDRALAETRRLTGTPRVDASEGMVVIGPGDAPAPANGPATAWLVRFDPREHQVAIGSGENGGRTIAHKNVVRELVELGRWDGTEARLRLPHASERGLASAVLVQAGAGGPIIAARRF